MAIPGVSGQPYMAGYMTIDYLSDNLTEEWYATAVRVTVSFKGTDNSIIQDGNSLGAGIAAQGPSTSGEPWPFGEPYIDYGYTLLLVVDNQHSSSYIQGTVWEVIEWGWHNLWPFEQPEAYTVDYFTWEYPQVLKMDSEVILKMEWINNLLFYSAVIGGVEYTLHIHVPNDIQLRVFMLGTTKREHKLIRLDGIVKWLQFPGA